MLKYLIFLSDSEIELVASAVRDWCRSHQRDVNSRDGDRALTTAVNLVQSKQIETALIPLLTQRLARADETRGQRAL